MTNVYTGLQGSFDPDKKWSTARSSWSKHLAVWSRFLDQTIEVEAKMSPIPTKVDEIPPNPAPIRNGTTVQVSNELHPLEKLKSDLMAAVACDFSQILLQRRRTKRRN